MRAYTGAGWLVPLCGDITQMPGLGKTPAALNVDIDDERAHGRAVLSAAVASTMPRSWQRGPLQVGLPAREPRASLVDVAEEALRRWLATGRHRAGERLPPEQELSARLGISRGTLRTALQRLEERGEIVRRQGSGTFVGRAARGRWTRGWRSSSPTTSSPAGAA